MEIRNKERLNTILVRFLDFTAPLWYVATLCERIYSKIVGQS
jgi:hypothetical protein